MTARAIVLLVGAASASRRLEISQTGPTTPKNTGDGCSPYISNDVAPWQTDNGGLAFSLYIAIPDWGEGQPVAIDLGGGSCGGGDCGGGAAFTVDSCWNVADYFMDRARLTLTLGKRGGPTDETPVVGCIIKGDYSGATIDYNGPNCYANAPPPPEYFSPCGLDATFSLGSVWNTGWTVRAPPPSAAPPRRHPPPHRYPPVPPRDVATPSRPRAPGQDPRKGVGDRPAHPHGLWRQAAVQREASQQRRAHRAGLP